MSRRQILVARCCFRPQRSASCNISTYQELLAKRHSCMELMACSWPLRGPGAQRSLIPCMRPGPPTQASATFRQSCANAPQGSPRLRCRMLELRLAEAIGIGLLRAGGRSWRPAPRHESTQLRTQMRHTNGQECAHPSTCIQLRAREWGGVHGVLRPAKRPRGFAPRSRRVFHSTRRISYLPCLRSVCLFKF